ncbi:MAG: hypothetical protein LBT80_07965 [Lactobacillaceae bacterium]|jgi:hypothetical protein|nr:hypothetical protein [Lactobacillaceae bacterium]
MTEEEQLLTFEPIICGVMKKGMVLYSDQHHDDYLQELRMLVLNKLREVPDLAATGNNKLFTWLLWRLYEMKRSRQVYTFRETQPILDHMEPYSQGDIYEADYRLMLAHLQRTKLSAEGVQRLLQDMLTYPRDKHAARIERLAISRTHYYRFLKQLHIDIDKFLVG